MIWIAGAALVIALVSVIELVATNRAFLEIQKQAAADRRVFAQALTDLRRLRPVQRRTEEPADGQPAPDPARRAVKRAQLEGIIARAAAEEGVDARWIYPTDL